MSPLPKIRIFLFARWKNYPIFMPKMKNDSLLISIFNIGLLFELCMTFTHLILRYMKAFVFRRQEFVKNPIITYPGIPPDSNLLAIVTSFDQTSNCHFRRPRTPHKTEPEWTPILMDSSTFKSIITHYITSPMGNECIN